ncbi:hypothetical protein E2542_SST26868 [Spatholobus suberectus]|nr:hypothetical protein E2542_SST26868 [Spatholobus suberectus]
MVRIHIGSMDRCDLYKQLQQHGVPKGSERGVSAGSESERKGASGGMREPL